MATEPEAAAVARGLTKRYANGVVALDQLDLNIGRASITALIGNNGSGKTTLLKIFAGLVIPDSGSAQTLECDPVTQPSSLRARLGYVSQAVELDPEMTGRETLGLFATLYNLPRARCQARLAALAESFGLAESLPRLVSSLSGGLRQRLHLAIGVLHEPELLLLDEPTAALDPTGRSFVWHLLQRLRNQGHTIVVVSHDLAEVSEHCQAIALLHRGRLWASGSPADVIAAHANWRLEVELAGTVDHDIANFQQLVSLPGLKSVYVSERQVVADFSERQPAIVQRLTDAILQQLVHVNAAVVGYRLQPPDLSSAYLNLTGAAIEDTLAHVASEAGKDGNERYRPKSESML